MEVRSIPWSNHGLYVEVLGNGVKFIFSVLFDPIKPSFLITSGGTYYF